jgi:hypothetical protein
VTHAFFLTKPVREYKEGLRISVNPDMVNPEFIFFFFGRAVSRMDACLYIAGKTACLL